MKIIEGKTKFVFLILLCVVLNFISEVIINLLALALSPLPMAITTLIVYSFAG